MTFWQSQLVQSPTLSDLLANENATLDEILSDDYTLQELKNDNTKLILFLMKPEILAELLNNALMPKLSTEVNEKQKFRLSHLSCELLTVNSNTMAAAIFESDYCSNLLGAYLSMVARDGLNPLLTSFYTRIVTHLMGRNCSKMLNILQGVSFFDVVFQNMATSAVMDLVLHLEEVPASAEDALLVETWFIREDFAKKLAKLFDKNQPTDVHCNAAHLWSELVRLRRDILYAMEDKAPDYLMDSLQKEDTIRLLLARMFPIAEQKNDSIITNGCKVISTLLQTNIVPFSGSGMPPKPVIMDSQNQNQQEEEPQAQAEANESISDGTVFPQITNVWQPDPDRVVEYVLVENLVVIHAFLRSKNVSENESNGIIDSSRGALGEAKLSLVKLLALLLNTNHLPTHNGFIQSYILNTLLHLVKDYPMNTLLHLAVSDCVESALGANVSSVEERKNYENSGIIRHLLVDCKLAEIIMENFDRQTADTSLSKIARIQLRAHNFSLATRLETARSGLPNQCTIKALLDELGLTERWSNFVQNQLIPYEKLNEPDKVEQPSARCPSNLTDEVEMPAITGDSIANEAFAEFQAQTLVRSIPDSFGLPMDTFMLSDMTEIGSMLDAKLDLIEADIKGDFDDMPPGEASFEALCAIRMSGAELMDKKISTNDNKNINIINNNNNNNNNNNTFNDPLGFNDETEEWPGEQRSGTTGNTLIDDQTSTAKKTSMDFEANFSNFPVSWRDAKSELEEQEEKAGPYAKDNDENWPAVEGSKSGNPDSAWADFGSPKAVFPSVQSTSTSDAWANFDQCRGSPDFFSSPVSSGIASSMVGQQRIITEQLSQSKRNTPPPPPKPSFDSP